MTIPGFELRAPGAGPRIALGTMNFGKRTPAAEATRIVRRALDRGVTVFDTANVYCDGESERILGRALQGARDRVQIATKVGLAMAGRKAEGLAPDRVLVAAEQSRARLGVDTIDVYYLHAPDPEVPATETLSAIAELLSRGKIKHWGVSNHASWQVLAMQHHCAASGIAGPIVSQVIYNMLIRQIEVEHLRFTRAKSLHTTVYNALAGGLLSERYQPGSPIEPGSRFDGNKLYQRRYWSERFLTLVEAYRAVAVQEGLTLVELAYAWLAAQPGVDSILVGPATVDQLDAALDASTRTLSGPTLGRIDEIHRAFLGTDVSYAR